MHSAPCVYPESNPTVLIGSIAFRMSGYCRQTCGQCTPSPPPPSAPAGCQSLGDTVSSLPELSTLKTALDKVGLLNQMKATNLSVTLLAPTNAAFSALASAANTTVDQLLGNTHQLELLLSYHIIPKVVRTSDLTDGQSLDTLLSRSGGGSLQVQVHKNGTQIFFSGSNTAKLVGADMTACQSVIQEIDQVLVPSV